MDYAEPMTLGSPVTSSGHVSPTHQNPHGSQFLPGYLMGDLSASSTPVLNRSKSMGSGGSQYNSPTVGGGICRTSPQKSQVRSPKHISFSSGPMPPKEKVGAPPVQTLMDDVAQAELARSSGSVDILSRTSAYHDVSTISPYSYGSPNTSRRTALKTLTPQKPKTPPSPGQTDPFYTQGELITPNVHLDDTWVTVFGFPTTSASFVMQRFSQYGNVLSHHIASDGGNWMHLHYDSSLQARKALSRNGKILPGNIMIGVIPCIDVKLMSENCPPSQSQNRSAYYSPALNSSLNRTGTPLRSNNKPTTIRPLTAAYNAVASENKVVSEVKTPQKASGLLTKAMDYMFG